MDFGNEKKLNNDVQFLQYLNLFKKVPDFFLVRLLACLEIKQYKKGDIILKQ